MPRSGIGKLRAQGGKKVVWTKRKNGERFRVRGEGVKPDRLQPPMGTQNDHALLLKTPVPAFPAKGNSTARLECCFRTKDKALFAWMHHSNQEEITTDPKCRPSDSRGGKATESKQELKARLHHQNVDSSRIRKALNTDGKT